MQTRPLPLLGPRKEALLSLTPRCGIAAEIGADHGITAAHLVQSGVAKRLVVTDISAASLEKAKRRFALHGLSDRADFRVADGLDALEEPVEAVLLAGLGTRTLCAILERGKDRIGDAALILQPQQSPFQLREWLMQNGFRVDAERIALEEGRYYVVLRARRAKTLYTQRELLLGPCLLRDRPPLYAAYLRWRRGCLLAVRGEDTRQAVAWIEEVLAAL